MKLNVGVVSPAAGYCLWQLACALLDSGLEESKTIIEGSLDRLLSTIKIEAAKRSSESVVVFVSPESRVTVDVSYSDDYSDSYLSRLKSEGFFILSLSQFSYFIQQLKSEGNLIPVTEFLRANTKFEWTPVYLPTPAAEESKQPREPPSSSEWKLPGWLLAPPPYLPLPRGLFKL